MSVSWSTCKSGILLPLIKEWRLFHLHLSSAFDCQIISNDLKRKLNERKKMSSSSIFHILNAGEKECFLSTFSKCLRDIMFYQERARGIQFHQWKTESNEEKAKSYRIDVWNIHTHIHSFLPDWLSYLINTILKQIIK